MGVLKSGTPTATQRRLLEAAQQGPIVPLPGGFWVREAHAGAHYVRPGAWSGTTANPMHTGLYLPGGERLNLDGTPGIRPGLEYWGTTTLKACARRGWLDPPMPWRYPYAPAKLTPEGERALQTTTKNTTKEKW